jgi:type III secretory pathway component EscV
MPTGFPRLSVRSGSIANPDFGRQMETLQDAVFQDFGVLVPRAQWLDDGSSADEAEVILNDQIIASHPTFSPQSEAGLLILFLLMTGDMKKHVADFVVPDLVEHYLQQLSDNLPDLVRTVRATFTMDQLTSLLQEKVRAGGSIRNLPAVLEDLLLPRSGEVPPAGAGLG